EAPTCPDRMKPPLPHEGEESKEQPGSPLPRRCIGGPFPVGIKARSQSKAVAFPVIPSNGRRKPPASRVDNRFGVERSPATEGAHAPAQGGMRSLTAGCRRERLLTAVPDDRGCWAASNGPSL